MIPFTALPWKLIGIGVLVLAIGALFIHDRHQTKLAEWHKSRADRIDGDFSAYRDAIDKERRMSKEALDERDRSLRELEEAKSATPVRSVRLCKPPNAVPATAPASSGIDARTAAGFSREIRPDSADGWGGDRWSDSGPDIGPQLYAEADRANEISAQCNALIKWVRSR